MPPPSTTPLQNTNLIVYIRTVNEARRVNCSSGCRSTANDIVRWHVCNSACASINEPVRVHGGVSELVQEVALLEP